MIPLGSKCKEIIADGPDRYNKESKDKVINPVEQLNLKIQSEIKKERESYNDYSAFRQINTMKESK